MKHLPPRLTAFTLLLLLPVLAGCGSGGDDGGEYAGTWAGTTSHGGTVTFTVDSGWVTSFRVSDSGANIWIQQPAEVRGNSFSVQNSENGSAPGAPGATVEGVFDSPTHCTGSYTLTQASRQWTGTFTASRP